MYFHKPHHELRQRAGRRRKGARIGAAVGDERGRLLGPQRVVIGDSIADALHTSSTTWSAPARCSCWRSRRPAAGAVRRHRENHRPVGRAINIADLLYDAEKRASTARPATSCRTAAAGPRPGRAGGCRTSPVSARPARRAGRPRPARGRDTVSRPLLLEASRMKSVERAVPLRRQSTPPWRSAADHPPALSRGSLAAGQGTGQQQRALAVVARSAARSNSARASSGRPRRSSRSPRTLGSRW